MVANWTATTHQKFSQEFRDESCREVISTSKPIRDVAEAYGIGTETLRNWLIKYRDANGGTEAELTVPERARLKELEREVQELKAEARFLKKAALDSTGQRNTIINHGGVAWRESVVRVCQMSCAPSCGDCGGRGSRSVRLTCPLF